MSRLFLLFWTIMFFPGYVVLWFSYYWPNERGRRRNVAQSRRQWQGRHIVAPTIAIPLYIVFIYFLDPGFMKALIGHLLT